MSAQAFGMEPMPAAYKEILGPELIDELDEAVLHSTPKELAETIFKVHAAVLRKRDLVRALELLFERVVRFGATDRARLDAAMELLASDDFTLTNYDTPPETSLNS
jgi:hypothetical protein